MNFFKIIISTIVVQLIAEGVVFAQQLPFYTQYRNNSFLFNPAIAGTKEAIDIRSSYRMQWVGYDGAPTTSALSIHSRLYKGKLGCGGYVVRDEIGPNQQTHYNLSGAYHIRFPDVELSIGIAANLTQYQLNGNKMTLHNGQDPSINQTITTSAWVKNAGAGFYLYNDRFNIGLSVIDYLKPEIKVFREDTSKHGIVKYIALANFIFGYNYALNDNFLCENNFYANYVAGAPILLDYTFRFHYKNKVFVGASVRLRDAFVAQAGFTLMEHIRVSYSYDMLVSNLRYYSGGTHEISLIFSHNLHHKKNRFLKQKFGYVL